MLVLLYAGDADARVWFHWPWYGYHVQHHYYHRHYYRQFHIVYRHVIAPAPAANPDRANLLNMRHKLDDAGRIIQEGSQPKP